MGRVGQAGGCLPDEDGGSAHDPDVGQLGNWPQTTDHAEPHALCIAEATSPMAF